MKTFVSSAFIFILLLVLNFSAFAQLNQTEAIVISTSTIDKDANVSTTKTFIDKDKILTETPGDNRENLILFDAEDEILYLINHEQKEVTEMTREDMQAVSAMLKQQMESLNKQLEMLPEEQRKMVKDKMKTAMGGQQEPLVYKLEEAGVPVQHWKSNKYVGTMNEKKKSEIYIASYAETGLEAEDFAAMQKFYALLKDFSSTLPHSTSMPFLSESMPGYEKGIPVKSVLYNAEGTATYTLMVEEIGEEVVADSVFAIPENYTRKKMEDLTGEN